VVERSEYSLQLKVVPSNLRYGKPNVSRGVAKGSIYSRAEMSVKKLKSTARRNRSKTTVTENNSHKKIAKLFLFYLM